MKMKIKVWREGKFIIISSREYGITTQGKSFQDALINFQDALLTCFHDPDWRHLHSISDSDYQLLIKQDREARGISSATIDIAEIITELVSDVKKTSYSIRGGTS